MQISLMTALALVISVSALLYLRNTDAKRRRSHHLPAWNNKRYTKLAWLLSSMPGLVLIGIEAYASFVMWFAAYSLVGWFVALPKPKQ